MSQCELVECFRQLLVPDCIIPNEGAKWIIQEEQRGAENNWLELRGGPALVFSLDRSGFDPLPFIRSKSYPTDKEATIYARLYDRVEPLAGVRQVCDALAVLQKNDVACIIAIEMKSKNAGHAECQIENSRLLVMEWLISSLKLYGHLPRYRKIDFYGVISFTPRNQERKGAGARAADLPKPTRSRHGYDIFHLRNHPRLDLARILDSSESKA